MVDQARLQEPTPLFIAPYSPGAGYITELPSSNAMNQTGQQKKGVVLGPPPSSRRGASSFYSNASFVSPIIEENPYSRSHGSYASSAAMPENWNSAAENNRNKNAETFYEESMTDVSPESVDGDFGDESRLVQPVELDSAAISVLGPNQQRPADVNRLQGMGANDKRTSWNVLGTARRMSEQPSRMVEGQPGQDDIIHAYAAASSGTPTDFRMGQSASANNTRNSAMKRGLRIDMDARAVETLEVAVRVLDSLTCSRHFHLQSRHLNSTTDRTDLPGSDKVVGR
ncbi:hypothetical protein LMH87_002228 [Akanthomyces muscarius]|uniref:Uncharacterized protein n=1 Tax=Akanthomyces muscarius TaxID=2231603 RepID=A0A9W8Q5V5_AKAMU|nr:hypothetical protein LMH87_002228 [Akanthomyces muscarius]KAJ4147720.1 hypothetical protein LMH87_002228 [Akanthomyces muscarius]